MKAEQRPARLPDRSGAARREGVALHFDVYGGAATTDMLLPTWSVVPSRFWKAQVACLVRHYRVITFDGRGAGLSSRPRGAAAFADREFAADALAVLDATETERAVLVGFSCGATWAVHLAAAHPDRALGIVAIAPACGLKITRPDVELSRWQTTFDDPRDGRNIRGTTGLTPHQRLCVVTVGGTAVGEPLLRRVLEAAPIARRLLPGLQFLIVTGPRIGAVHRRRCARGTSTVHSDTQPACRQTCRPFASAGNRTQRRVNEMPFVNVKVIQGVVLRGAEARHRAEGHRRPGRGRG